MYAGQSTIFVDLTPNNQALIELKGWEKIRHSFAGMTLKFHPLNKGIYSKELPFFLGLRSEYGFPKSTTFNSDPIEDHLPGITDHWSRQIRIGAFIGIGIL